eukprot:CAMPEP_0118953258 /NCGR_PEP_ID=MMETSP1169-20130426/56256_1 /TAXON_ID=36882 /ORGANISM="Pyramimonas obovata, Strain CCMP722" /LENGTH=232 /DNA_ID=CAMNT_0006900675 /DNA_START=306 /DNA_END=1004 /DNA_ORIENTATION=-
MVHRHQRPLTLPLALCQQGPEPADLIGGDPAVGAPPSKAHLEMLVRGVRGYEPLSLLGAGACRISRHVHCVQHYEPPSSALSLEPHAVVCGVVWVVLEKSDASTAREAARQWFPTVWKTFGTCSVLNSELNNVQVSERLLLSHITIYYISEMKDTRKFLMHTIEVLHSQRKLWARVPVPARYASRVDFVVFVTILHVADQPQTQRLRRRSTEEPTGTTCGTRMIASKSWVAT